MATNNSTLNIFLELHEANVDLNCKIKDFKKNPGDLTAITGKFFKIQSALLDVRSQVQMQDQVHLQMIDLALELTKARVEKLAKKIPSQPIQVSTSTTFFGQSLMTPAQQIADRAHMQGFISFYDDQADRLTGCFGNFHKCSSEIEFDGKKYSNSEAIFQSRKFTDQHGVFAQFTNTVDGDTAVQIARQNNMSATKLKEWDDLHRPHTNKVDVMMNALRAKFGQNSDLKDRLMATGSAYLVEHLPDANRRDRFWSDGFDGTGENMLGICLMKLRQEYGGTGVVSKPPAYLSMVRNHSSILSSQNAHTATLTSSSFQCLVDCCTKTAYTGYKFCGRTHGQQYMSVHGRCKRCNVEPRHAEKDLNTGTIIRVHDYCGKNCARLAGTMQ